MTVDWREALKLAGPVVGSFAGAQARNRGEENVLDITRARDAEQAAVDRARAQIEAGTLAEAQARGAREAESQAIKNAFTAALMKNTQDVSFDRSGFRSKVPTLSFGGGSRPSNLGAEGQHLADLMQNRSLQTLMAPPVPQGGSAAPRGGDGAAMPAYVPPEENKASIWEKALGAAGLGSTVAGALFGGGGGAGAPGAAGVARGVAGAAGAAAGPPASSVLRGVPGLGASTIDTSAVTGLMPASSSSMWSGLNSVAGPAAFGLGVAAPFLPAGSARTAADWASKGAQAGSFVPGVGTAIGAGIGAAAGAIKGHQNETVGDREEFARQVGYRSLDDLYKALTALGPEGQELTRQGLNVIGKHDKDANNQWIGRAAQLLGRR